MLLNFAPENALRVYVASKFSQSKQIGLLAVWQVYCIVLLFILLKFVDGICMPSIAECSSENDVVIGFK